ncbi:ABC transporter ATP-binding protein [Streptomyces sp. SID3343]|uniref:ABC transporter ATP-binding protein n=1 Tax=Streptomyces sp. SID3343 TaxID=2690260 RepID=UPI001371A87A|nr:ABC transporter ATP-binding protein [Streptomyces sp. SID3343]MYV98748.1 ATP-binding cassette domain-containing protein [Streptomyces sp. SID3343]
MSTDDPRPSGGGLLLTDVTLTYPDGDGRLTALDRVSLTAAPGTLTAVVGPSGSGKSSLLAVAATLTAPDTGQVVVAGHDAATLSAGERARLRRASIGIVFQQPNLLASLTCVEQLQVMAHLDGRRAAGARARALDLLDRVGIADHAKHRPHRLSGGQRQRVNIARALMNEPSVLLIDEPTSALDHERGAAVVSLLAELTHATGTATVMVTHDHSHLVHADQALEVIDGRLGVLSSTTT